MDAGGPQADAELVAALAGPGDDRAAMVRVTAHVEALEAQLEAARVARLELAARMRGAGMSGLEIAKLARVGDSYLSRQAIARGLPRRTDRTRRAADTVGAA